MQWHALDTWIVIVGTLSAVSCAMLGTFLVLRRMSMMGDAISHAVLPGLALAFVITGSRASLPMFIGAAAVGVLTALLTQWVHQLGKVEHSAAMGTVFTTLFAIGLILIVRAADKVDLDPGCVLYGAIEATPLDTVVVAGMRMPRAALVLGIVLICNLAFIALCYKELKISSFDPALATTLGINANLMHYLLMAFVAVTTVACFEAVGSIIVIAMLIVPAATAYLLTDRLSIMLMISVVVGGLCSIAGHLSALIVPGCLGFDSDTKTSGMMAVVAGVLFAGALMAGPRHGLISRYVSRARVRLRVVREDILGMLYRLEEAHSLQHDNGRIREVLNEALAIGPLLRHIAFRRLVQRGDITATSSAAAGYKLTATGRAQAQAVVRSHRLWETYLAQHLALPIDHVHEPASRLEHLAEPELTQQLSEESQHATIDPHGREVPPATSSGTATE